MLEKANESKILKRFVSYRQLQRSSKPLSFWHWKTPCSIIEQRLEEIRFLNAKWFDHKQEVLLIDLQLAFYWQQSSNKNNTRSSQPHQHAIERGRGFLSEWHSRQAVRMEEALTHFGLPLVRKTFANRLWQEDRCSKRGNVSHAASLANNVITTQTQLFTHKWNSYACV